MGQNGCGLSKIYFRFYFLNCIFDATDSTPIITDDGVSVGSISITGSSIFKGSMFELYEMLGTQRSPEIWALFKEECAHVFMIY